MEEPNPPAENSRLIESLSPLKEASKLPFKNARFASFIIFSSLPLLFFMLLFEILLEKTMHEYSIILNSYTPPPFHYYANKLFWLLPFPYYWYDDNKKMDFVYESYQKLIILFLLYLFPLHLVEFLTAFFCITSTSKTFKLDQKSSNISIKDMIVGNKDKLKGSFVTSLYILFLSTSFLSGFILLVMGYYSFYLIYALIFVAIFLVSLPKSFEISAAWNLGMVVSVLENIQGIDALSYSFNLCKRKEKLGRDLMLVFMVWRWSLRIPCLFFDDGLVGVLGRTCLMWLGGLMKWVVFVVYYHHCKSSAFCNMADEELGGEINSAEVVRDCNS